MADKKVCPDCPKHYVWNRESRFNAGCLMLMTAFPFILIIFFLVLYFFNLR